MFDNEFDYPAFHDIAELIQQYENAVKSNITPQFDEQSFEALITFYQENREFKKALNVIDTAVGQYPFSGEFLLKKAEVLIEQNRLDEAMEIINYAEALDPTEVGIAFTRADILLQKGEHEQALAEVDRGLIFADNHADSCELFLLKADIYEDKQLFYEVIDCLQQALYYEPENEEALQRLWFAYEITELYDSSISFHEKLIDKNPYNHLAWFNLGQAYAGKEEWEKAREAFEFAVAIKEDFEAGYCCIGDTYMMQEQYVNALDNYLEATKIGRPSRELFVKIAECYEKLKEYSKARNYLRKAISADPEFCEGFYLLGEIYKKEENWTQAINALERAVRLDRENVEYLLSLADAYLQIDESAKAFSLLENAYRFASNNKEQLLSIAVIFFNAECEDEAFIVLREAEKRFPNHADVLFLKAALLYRDGAKNEALAVMESALMMNYELHHIFFDVCKEAEEDPEILQLVSQFCKPNLNATDK